MRKPNKVASIRRPKKPEMQPQVSIVPAKPNVMVGDEFTVDVVARNFSQATTSATIGISFDHHALRLISFALTDRSPFDFIVANDPLYGVLGPVTLLAPLHDTNPIGDFRALTLRFKATATGKANLNVFEDDFDGWLGADLARIPVEYLNTSVRVAVSPLPAALHFMVSGLTGRRSKRFN